MSELTVTVLRLGLLVLLWVFVLSVASVLRTDLFGTRVVNRRPTPPKKAARASRSARSKEAPEATTPCPPRNPRTPTHLVLTTGPLTGTSLPLRDSGVLIGRNPECALVLDDGLNERAAATRRATVDRAAPAATWAASQPRRAGRVSAAPSSGPVVGPPSPAARWPSSPRTSDR